MIDTISHLGDTNNQEALRLAVYPVESINTIKYRVVCLAETLKSAFGLIRAVETNLLYIRELYKAMIIHSLRMSSGRAKCILVYSQNYYPQMVQTIKALFYESDHRCLCINTRLYEPDYGVNSTSLIKYCPLCSNGGLNKNYTIRYPICGVINKRSGFKLFSSSTMLQKEQRIRYACSLFILGLTLE